MSFTPGPWVIRGKSSMDEYTQVILPQDPTFREGRAIAHVFDDPSVDMGDALLIAAAPDLLAACKELRDGMAAAMRVIDNARTEKADILDDFMDECKASGVKNGIGVRAQEAIAKAEGR